ncbi:hypothetical protein CEXT_423351 [Caerostris extrusa]|uniref:Uncharacterized protein n=1 Tax=Caerostris extrusa TaxID=172846 RepID=A0AAV4W1B5_CAEEX|nr:hypothetical protein CEXT_423351 [Caerostris extrusa]
MRCARRRTIGEIGFPQRSLPPIKRRLASQGEGDLSPPPEDRAPGSDAGIPCCDEGEGDAGCFLGKENSRLEENILPESDSDGMRYKWSDKMSRFIYLLWTWCSFLGGFKSEVPEFTCPL